MSVTRRGFFRGAAGLALAAAAPSLSGSQSAGKGGCDSSEKTIKAADKRTGREVWQITSGQDPSNSCYFEAQAFTAGDRHLVYASKRSGVYQLYRLDLASQETCPVTHGYGISSLSFSIAPDGKTVYYTEGGRVYRTDVMTGATAVLEFEAGFAVSRYKGPIKFSLGRTFTPDGEYSALGWTDAAGKTGVALVNLAKGIVTKYIEVPGGTGGHTLLCPADPYLVTFVHAPDQQNNMKLPMEQRARSMIIDFRTGQIRPFLIMPYGWRATHEYWSPKGDRLYFHKKRVPGWVPAGICSVKRDGSNLRSHFTSDTLQLGHSMISPDERFIVSDVQKAHDNPLLLIELASGKHQVLCWPDSSATSEQIGHVHPSFSRTAKFVAYTSDRTGTAQVYLVPV